MNDKRQKSDAYGICVVLLLTILCTAGCRQRAGKWPESHYEDKLFAQAEQIRSKQSPEKAIRFVDSAYASFPEINVADKLRYYKFRAGLLIEKRYSPRTDSALRYVDSMQKLIEDNNLTEVKADEYARIFSLKGHYLHLAESYGEAIDATSRAKLIGEQTGDSCMVGESESELALIAYRQSKFAEAVVYFKKALALFPYCSDARFRFYMIQGHSNNLGLSYLKQNQYDSALKYFESSLNYVEQNKQLYSFDTPFVNIARSVIKNNLANTYRKKKEMLDVAEKYLKDNIDFFRRTNDSDEEARVKLSLAGLYLEQGKRAEASALITEATPVLVVIPTEKDQLALLEIKWKEAAAYGNYQEEMGAMQRYYAKKETMQTQQDITFPANLEAVYDRIKRQHEVALLKKDASIQRIFLVSASIIGLLLAVLMFNIIATLKRSRKMIRQMRRLNETLSEREQALQQLLIDAEQRKKKEQMEELFVQEVRLQAQHNEQITNQRKQISDDMHDELASSLAALNYYVNDLKKTAPDNTAKNTLEEISSEIATIYKNARTYIHNLKAGNLEVGYDIPAFLAEIASKFSEKTSLRINYIIDEGALKKLTVQENNQLYHIIKEAISNTIKHASASEIRINIGMSNDQCIFTIADNGSGFKQEYTVNGIGLNSIQSRIASLGGSLTIDGSKNGVALSGSFHVYAHRT